MVCGVEVLMDLQWECIEVFVFGGCEGCCGFCSDNWCFVNVLIWMVCLGSWWWDLFECFGNYQMVKWCYYCWVENGVFDQFFVVFVLEVDLDWVLIDSISIWVQVQVLGVLFKRGVLWFRVLVGYVVGQVLRFMYFVMFLVYFFVLFLVWVNVVMCFLVSFYCGV